MHTGVSFLSIMEKCTLDHSGVVASNENEEHSGSCKGQGYINQIFPLRTISERYLEKTFALLEGALKNYVGCDAAVQIQQLVEKVKSLYQNRCIKMEKEEGAVQKSRLVGSKIGL